MIVLFKTAIAKEKLPLLPGTSCLRDSTEIKYASVDLRDVPMKTSLEPLILSI